MTVSVGAAMPHQLKTASLIKCCAKHLCAVSVILFRSALPYEILQAATVSGKAWQTVGLTHCKVKRMFSNVKFQRESYFPLSHCEEFFLFGFLHEVVSRFFSCSHL